MNEAFRQHLLRLLHYAPSADNSRPCLCRWLSETQLAIEIDPQKSGSVSDERYLLSDLAAGTSIETLTGYARLNGYACEIVYFPNDNPLHVANIQFAPAKAEQLPTLPYSETAIYQRRTNRHFPWRHRATKCQLDIFATQRPDMVNLTFFNNNLERRVALAVIRRAESLRFQHKPLHHELFSSIRFDAGWKNRVDTGLSPCSLGVEWLLRPLFQSLRHWRLMQAFNYIGGSYLMGLRAAALPAMLSPHIGLIHIDNRSRTSIIHAGRYLQYLWLGATQQGLNLQPFAAIGAVFMGSTQIPDISAIRDSLMHALRPYINDTLPLLMFRLGK